MKGEERNLYKITQNPGLGLLGKQAIYVIFSTVLASGYQTLVLSVTRPIVQVSSFFVWHFLSCLKLMHVPDLLKLLASRHVSSFFHITGGLSICWKGSV